MWVWVWVWVWMWLLSGGVSDTPRGAHDDLPFLFRGPPYHCDDDDPRLRFFLFFLDYDRSARLCIVCVSQTRNIVPPCTTNNKPNDISNTMGARYEPQQTACVSDTSPTNCARCTKNQP